MIRFSPLGERPIKALAWLTEQRGPGYWCDMVDAAGGYRPSYHLVIRPLMRRDLVALVKGPRVGDHFEPTLAGFAFVAGRASCPCRNG